MRIGLLSVLSKLEVDDRDATKTSPATKSTAVIDLSSLDLLMAIIFIFFSNFYSVFIKASYFVISTGYKLKKSNS